MSAATPAATITGSDRHAGIAAARDGADSSTVATMPASASTMLPRRPTCDPALIIVPPHPDYAYNTDQHGNRCYRLGRCFPSGYRRSTSLHAHGTGTYPIHALRFVNAHCTANTARAHAPSFLFPIADYSYILHGRRACWTSA